MDGKWLVADPTVATTGIDLNLKVVSLSCGKEAVPVSNRGSLSIGAEEFTLGP